MSGCDRQGHLRCFHDLPSGLVEYHRSHLHMVTVRGRIGVEDRWFTPQDGHRRQCCNAGGILRTDIAAQRAADLPRACLYVVSTVVLATAALSF